MKCWWLVSKKKKKKLKTEVVSGFWKLQDASAEEEFTSRSHKMPDLLTEFGLCSIVLRAMAKAPQAIAVRCFLPNLITHKWWLVIKTLTHLKIRELTDQEELTAFLGSKPFYMTKYSFVGLWWRLFAFLVASGRN